MSSLHKVTLGESSHVLKELLNLVAGTKLLNNRVFVELLGEKTQFGTRGA